MLIMPLAAGYAERTPCGTGNLAGPAPSDDRRHDESENGQERDRSIDGPAPASPTTAFGLNVRAEVFGRVTGTRVHGMEAAVNKIVTVRAPSRAAVTRVLGSVGS